MSDHTLFFHDIKKTYIYIFIFMEVITKLCSLWGTNTIDVRKKKDPSM